MPCPGGQSHIWGWFHYQSRLVDKGQPDTDRPWGQVEGWKPQMPREGLLSPLKVWSQVPPQLLSLQPLALNFWPSDTKTVLL